MGILSHTPLLLCKLNKSRPISNFKICSLFLYDRFKSVKSNTSLFSTSWFVASTSIALHALSAKNDKRFQKVKYENDHIITEVTDYSISSFKYLLKICKYCCGFSRQSDISSIITFYNPLHALATEEDRFSSLSEKFCLTFPQAPYMHHLCIWPSTSKTFTSNFKDLWNSPDIRFIEYLKNLDEIFQKKFSTMENESNHLIFVYGTLKMGEPNHDLIKQRTEGKAVFMGNAVTVKKWPLIIASRYNIPHLLYCEGKGENVVGEVYEVDNTMLTKFDELECHPNYYTRLVEEVQLLSENDSDKKLIRPWIYFLKNFRDELLDLPCLSDYSSKGSHGLEYVTSEDISNPEDIYT